MLFYYRKIPIEIIFAHKILICQPIFKIIAGHFTTNLVINIVKRIVCHPLKKLYIIPKVKIKTVDLECVSRRCLGHNLTYDEDLS